MKVKFVSVLAAGLMIGLMSGCAVKAPFQPPMGAVTSVSAPLTTDVNSVKAGMTHGQSSAINILGLVSLGDCGLNAAMKNGHINTVQYADYSFFNILFFYSKTTLNVYGE